MKIEAKRVVAIHYALTGDDGKQIDASSEGEPLVYLHGVSGLIPGLERSLEGKVAGDQLQVSIASADAYGEINPEMIQVAPREAFVGIDDVQPGMQFEARGEDGQAQMVTIESVGEEGVTVNGNHPLAGQTLNFDVTIAEVREATAEELEHGHAHADGHHHH